MADRNGAVARPAWMKQAEEAKLRIEAEKAAAAKAAFEATFKDVEKSKSQQEHMSSSDSEAEEAEDRLASKPIGPADPGRCTAAGPGMGGGAACASCTFTVTTKDSDGRKIPNGGAQIKVKVIPGTMVGGSDIDGIVKDQGDGTYAVTYVVPQKGDYMVCVECNEKPIMGSPFPVFFSAGSAATGGLLGFAPSTTYPNLVNQNMPNMPNYSASISGAFSGLLGMIPGLVPGPSGGVILPAVGTSLGEICREYLNGRCFETNCKLNHPQHNLLMAAVAATANMSSLSQAPMAPSAAAMAAAQAIMAAQALQAHASQHAQSQTSKNSAGTSEKEGKADTLKRTLQVSNLNPMLTVDQLKQLFGFCGRVVECTITDSKHFAYIEYSKPEEATAALSLNNMDVAGRPLNVEMAKSLPQKPVSSVGSSSLPLMMQQAVAMQQMQFQQALLAQQTMAAQQAAHRAATVKSATEIASARAAEISRRLKAEGLGSDDKETERKSRSPANSRERSKSRSKSPAYLPRRNPSRSPSPVSRRPKDHRSRSPVRYRCRSRSLSPPIRRTRSHRSRSPLRSRRYSNYDYDYGRWSYNDSKDGGGRSRRLDYPTRGNKSRSISPRGRGRKSYRDDSGSPKHRRRGRFSHRSRSPGGQRESRTSPLKEDGEKSRHRRSRSPSANDKHKSTGRREVKKEELVRNHSRRRSRSISPEDKNVLRKSNSISSEGKNHRASLSPLHLDEMKAKRRKRSRSRSSDTKYRSKNKDSVHVASEFKQRERRRSRSTDCKDIKSTSRSDKIKSRERRRSRSKSLEGHRESDEEKDRNRRSKRKHQDRRRSRSASVDRVRRMEKSKSRHPRRSRSKSAELQSDESIDTGVVEKSKYSHSKELDRISFEPKDCVKDTREHADDETSLNLSRERGSSMVETKKAETDQNQSIDCRARSEFSGPDVAEEDSV